LYALSTIVDNKTKIIIMTDLLMKILSIWKITVSVSFAFYENDLW